MLLKDGFGRIDTSPSEEAVEENRQAVDAWARAGMRIISRVNHARSSVISFGEFVFTDETGNPVRAAPIHRAWMAHIRTCWELGRHAAILAPWGHGKSVWVARILPLFLLGHDPQLRIKVICNDDDNAKQDVAVIASTIEENARFQAVFPECRRDIEQEWTQHKLFVQREGDAADASIEAKSVMSKGVGRRSDVTIYDDVEDFDNSIRNPALRPIVWGAMTQKWQSRLDSEESRSALVGTIWHQHGLNCRIQDHPGWCTLIHRVASDCKTIEQELINPPTGYFDLIRSAA